MNKFITFLLIINSSLKPFISKEAKGEVSGTLIILSVYKYIKVTSRYSYVKSQKNERFIIAKIQGRIPCFCRLKTLKNLFGKGHLIITLF